MTYEVIFGAGAAVKYHELPESARDAVVARAVRLASAPWDEARVVPPADDPAFRETVFGGGFGVMAFHVDDTTETIRIFNFVWAG